MGMSADYQEAIKFNSTYLRIGSNIFLNNLFMDPKEQLQMLIKKLEQEIKKAEAIYKDILKISSNNFDGI